MRVEPGHGRSGGADARHDQRVGAAQRLRVARDRDRRTDARQRLVDAHQVARAVIDDRQPGRRAHSRTPLVEATPVRRGSMSQAARSARASALKAASAR